MSKIKKGHPCYKTCLEKNICVFILPIIYNMECYSLMTTTEVIDKLFLELSQFTTARSAKEIMLAQEVAKLRNKVVELEEQLIKMRNLFSKSD